ncbi:Clp protease N-terminal domain-containing protein [Streptomyces physcomitrii]|uniref:Peptidase n=1 Tax=Streptomyces physcomitrii TaxID=2724184 RepID=A0ABX1GYL0_9ACTN|nr:Clp protease N-terminal domain-containing protein [Streptomyces physcomitrii]NKI40154.1 peptidase [Streptomyces physcomitrii]
MFERFTRSAEDVVKGALDHADRAGSRRVESAHLLRALLDGEGSRGAFVLVALGVPERRASLERALDLSRRRAGLSGADSRALAELGIDVEAVVSRVEDVHGEGALADRPRPRSLFGPRRPFGKEAKDVLTRSLRIVTARGERRIGDEHLLLALTTHPGAVAEALADHGVTHASVERILYGEGEDRGQAKAG